jgi:hypothetical protein
VHIASPLVDIAGSRGYGCAMSLPRLRVPIAVQSFERGTMIWLSHPAEKPGTIFVVFREPTTDALVWQQYPDVWHAGEPLPDQAPPPSGRYLPVHGFGLLWSTNTAVRSALGWAIAPEQGDRGDTQRFYVNSGVNRLTIITSPGTQRQYLLYDGPFPPDHRDTAEVIASIPHVSTPISRRKGSAGITRKQTGGSYEHHRWMGDLVHRPAGIG